MRDYFEDYIDYLSLLNYYIKDFSKSQINLRIVDEPHSHLLVVVELNLLRTVYTLDYLNRLGHWSMNFMFFDDVNYLNFAESQRMALDFDFGLGYYKVRNYDYFKNFVNVAAADAVVEG